jgi:dUTP pyrophosphatase
MGSKDQNQLIEASSDRAMEHNISVRVKRVRATAKIPTQGSAHAAGFDLYAAETTVVLGSRIIGGERVEVGRASIPTGLIVEIPRGFYGRIAPRSGLAIRHGMDTLAGVVDPDFRSEVVVLLANFGSEDVVIEQGERCAQIIFEQIGQLRLHEADELTPTERGEGGFGSTGRK